MKKEKWLLFRPLCFHSLSLNEVVRRQIWVKLVCGGVVVVGGVEAGRGVRKEGDRNKPSGDKSGRASRMPHCIWDCCAWPRTAWKLRCRTSRKEVVTGVCLAAASTDNQFHLLPLAFPSHPFSSPKQKETDLKAVVPQTTVRLSRHWPSSVTYSCTLISGRLSSVEDLSFHLSGSVT